MTSRVPLWLPDLAPPDPAVLPLPDRIEHLVIQRSRPPWQFLHESCLCAHNGSLYAAWNACPRGESEPGSAVRWARSADGGYTWSAPQLLAAPLDAPDAIWESCQLLSAYGALWAFAGQVQTQPRIPNETGGRMLVLRLDETRGAWEPESAVEGFHPLNRPQPLPGGAWLMGGQYNLYQPRVARSAGADLTRWQVIEIPFADDDRVHFAETSLAVVDGCAHAVIRSAAETLYVSESRDGGASWSPLALSNLPAADSKTCGGVLSTGQRYLALNLRPTRPGSQARDVLALLVGAPGEALLRKAVLIRCGSSPRARLSGFGKVEQWSYPSVEELDGRVCVSYSITKEDLGLSLLPLAALATGDAQ